jgi:hypothetical protein
MILKLPANSANRGSLSASARSALCVVLLRSGLLKSMPFLMAPRSSPAFLCSAKNRTRSNLKLRMLWTHALRRVDSACRKSMDGFSRMPVALAKATFPREPSLVSSLLITVSNLGSRNSRTSAIFRADSIIACSMTTSIQSLPLSASFMSTPTSSRIHAKRSLKYEARSPGLGCSSGSESDIALVSRSGFVSLCFALLFGLRFPLENIALRNRENLADRVFETLRRFLNWDRLGLHAQKIA